MLSGQTTRCHPRFTFPEGFYIFYTDNHWANEEKALRYIDKILPYVNCIRHEGNMLDQDAHLILDSFTGQKTTQVIGRKYLVFVPGGTTDHLQPLVNKSAKDFMRENFCQWYAKEVEKAVQFGSEYFEVGMKGTSGLQHELYMITCVAIPK